MALGKILPFKSSYYYQTHAPLYCVQTGTGENTTCRVYTYISVLTSRRVNLHIDLSADCESVCMVRCTNKTMRILISFAVRFTCAVMNVLVVDGMRNPHDTVPQNTNNNTAVCWLLGTEERRRDGGGNYGNRMYYMLKLRMCP